VNIFAGGNIGQIDNTSVNNNSIFYFSGVYKVA